MTFESYGTFKMKVNLTLKFDLSITMTSKISDKMMKYFSLVIISSEDFNSGEFLLTDEWEAILDSIL